MYFFHDGLGDQEPGAVAGAEVIGVLDLLGQMAWIRAAGDDIR